MDLIYQVGGERERGTELNQRFKQFIGGALDRHNGRLHPSVMQRVVNDVYNENRGFAEIRSTLHVTQPKGKRDGCYVKRWQGGNQQRERERERR